MCNKATYNNVLSEIAKYRNIKKECEDILSDLEEEVKEYMTLEGMETLIGDEHTATYRAVTSSRFDSKSFKLDYPDMYDKYSRESVSQRFNFK